MINNFDGEYRFLSNFANSKIVYEGIEYPTVEHAFQAAKTLNMNQRKEIAALKTPGEAKRAGRREVILRKDWEKVKDGIMYDLLKLKFENPVLRKKLIATGNELLEEGTTWHDNYWGNCYCDRCKNISGKNMLGILLMKVRSEIK